VRERANAVRPYEMPRANPAFRRGELRSPLFVKF